MFDNLLATIKDRMSNTFFMCYLGAFCAKNWKLLLVLLFEDETGSLTRIDHIKKLYGSGIVANFEILILWPLSWAVVIFVFLAVSKHVSIYSGHLAIQFKDRITLNHSQDISDRKEKQKKEKKCFTEAYKVVDQQARILCKQIEQGQPLDVLKTNAANTVKIIKEQRKIIADIDAAKMIYPSWLKRFLKGVLYRFFGS